MGTVVLTLVSAACLGLGCFMLGRDLAETKYKARAKVLGLLLEFSFDEDINNEIIDTAETMLPLHGHVDWVVLLMDAMRKQTAQYDSGAKVE